MLGANEQALRMLEEIGGVENIPKFIEDVKAKKRRLMGYICASALIIGLNVDLAIVYTSRMILERKLCSGLQWRYSR